MTQKTYKWFLLGGIVLLVAAAVFAFQGTSVVKAQDQPAPPFTATVAMVAINPDQGVMVPLAKDPTKTAKLFTPGLANVPPGVPQYVRAGAISLAEGAKIASYDWKITGPEGTAVKIAAVTADPKTKLTADMATFTPDKTGNYTITLVVKDDKGAESKPGEFVVQVATYVGSDTCKTCHAEVYTKWQSTGHATFFKEMIDTNAEGEYAEAGFGCARCHTAGYYPISKEATGGWWDVFVNVLKLDPVKDFGDKVKLAKAGTFDAMDAKLKSLGNINCESCHGPGGGHAVDQKANPMGVSTDSGVCDQCHNDGHFHTRGESYGASGHSANKYLTFINGRAECSRCHSPQGFIDFLGGVAADKRANTVGEIACTTCHNPHDGKNYMNLRVVNEVKEGAAPIKDAGLSAICMDCHWSNASADSVKTDKTVYPHYSSSTELVYGIGGYDFGFKIPNSKHVTWVGKAVLKDDDMKELHGGNVPGACVYCHMYRTPGGVENASRTDDTEITAENFPGHNEIGGHSFAMATEEGGKEVQHLAACQNCHQGIQDFNFKAEADYDGNGKIEGVQTEVKGLLELVKKELAVKGVKELPTGYPYFDIPKDATEEVKGAIFNFRYVYGVMWGAESKGNEGRGAAIHNFSRSVALLQVSYFKLTGKDVAGATILYTK